jgi:hypothetical protein
MTTHDNKLFFFGEYIVASSCVIASGFLQIPLKELKKLITIKIEFMDIW